MPALRSHFAKEKNFIFNHICLTNLNEKDISYNIGGVFINLSGCIKTPEPEVPKRVSFLFNVRSIGESILVGQDSIVVDEFKLIADKFDIELPDESILQTSVDALAFIY